MVKLQEIKRKNNSKVYSVNIPLDVIEHTGWIKGQEIEVIPKFGEQETVELRSVNDGD